jgi:hypothetical protein
MALVGKLGFSFIKDHQGVRTIDSFECKFHDMVEYSSRPVCTNHCLAISCSCLREGGNSSGWDDSFYVLRISGTIIFSTKRKEVFIEEETREYLDR